MTSVWFWSKLWYSWMWSKLLNLEQIWLVKILVFLILEQIWLVKIHTLEDSKKLQDSRVFLSYEEVDLGICLLSGTAPTYWSRDQSTELQKSKVSNHQPSRQTTERFSNLLCLCIKMVVYGFRAQSWPSIWGVSLHQWFQFDDRFVPLLQVWILLL